MPIKLCPVCGCIGTLMEKTSKTKTSTGEYKTYRYWYFYHGKDSKKQWCYLNKKLLTIPEIKEAIKQTTQTTTQIIKNVENLNSIFISPNDDKARRADRLVWLGYHPYEVMVAGSNPARPTKSSGSIDYKQRTLPDLAVPILQLLQEGSSGDYGMFQDFRKYHWVQPVFRYKDLTYLINSLDTNAIESSEAKARELEKR